MSYLCVSHASQDRALAERFEKELTKYGFSHAFIDEQTPEDLRALRLSEGELLVVLTSAESASDRRATDLRRAVGSGKPCVCVSLSDNTLDKRFCAAEGAVPSVPYPGSETDTPDERSVALFIHRLYIRHLCPLTGCFSAVRCVDDPYGRAITHACKAYAGDEAARFALGEAYLEGLGLPVLEAEAARWIGMAAEAEYPDALVRMGELRLDGEGVERDPGEALRLFSAAAKAGDPRGQFARGICCLYGYGVMKDPEMAMRYFRAAAGDGYIPALYRVGLLYRDGLGTACDHRLAVKYLYAAAVGRGDTLPPLYGTRITPVNAEGKRRRRRFACVSMRFMRQKKLDALLGATSDGDQSHRFCKVFCKSHRIDYPENSRLNAADMPGEHPRRADYSHQAWNPSLAESALGRLLEQGDESQEIRPSPRAALAWYRRAALHGHVGAVFRLGDAYRSGRGIPKDAEQSVRLFRLAAELGSRRGQFAMGVCCERGEGIPQNLEMAVTWYEQAAREGYAPAQNNLGGCFEQGIGVPEDPLAAVEWFTRASAGGEPNATCRLALCYENGRGVTQNLERAFHLYEDAARHKHPVALYRLGLYYDRGITVNPQVAYAAHLFERAAIAGVGDAAYALALCCREGRGRRRNDRESLEWLREAERLGSVQGAYELGMTRFEGRATVQNRQAALASFEKSAAALSATSPRALKASDKFLPADGISAVQAAGKALYMLGYDAAEHQKYEEALTYLDRAAELGCGEAFTAIGDLYTHGLIGRNDPVLDRTAALEAYEAAAEKKRPEALLSLAKAYEEMAVEDEKQGLTDKAAKKRELAFRCLSRCVKMGSKSALVGMAGCYWFGYGVRRNRDTAYDYLRRANGYTAEEQPQEREENTVAALWLGDLFWSAMETASSVTSKATCAKAARAAYRSAIRAPLGRGENLPYALSVRRKRSEALETRAKAEAHYRLAVLNLLYFKDKLTEREVYGPLGEAVLSQHARALDDLTRLYLFEKQRSSERMAAEAARRPAGLMERLRQGKAKGTQRPESKAAATAAMLADFSDGYYAALRLLPAPFDLAPPAPRASEADLSEDLTRPLSDTQRAEALNRLGDRYFYGKGIAENKTSAVACYRRAAATVQPRGEAVSGGIIWAQYSLGYCLLHGIGTKKDPREAVRWLTSAAKYHGEAALCLAKCHESGVGVDRVDRLEALKFYRRALKFGHKEATEAITVLEAEIKEEAQA